MPRNRITMRRLPRSEYFVFEYHEIGKGDHADLAIARVEDHTSVIEDGFYQASMPSIPPAYGFLE